MMLWLLLGLLAGAGTLAISYPVPLYAQGIAVLSSAASDTQGTPRFVLIMPVEQRALLRIGQRVLIRQNSAGPVAKGRITSIFPGNLTGSQIEHLIDQTASAGLTLTGSKAVALAELDPASTIVRARGNVPGCCEVLVEAGSRRAIALFRWGRSD